MQKQLCKNNQMCKNFIILKYSKSKLDRQVDEASKNLYLSSQGIMFWKMIKQLTAHYPDSYIHVLTNENMSPANNKIVVHKFEFEPTHCCKFLLYGLLDEPAFYFDCDIVIKRKFYDHELKSSNPFRMYNAFGGTNGQSTDYSKLSRQINIQIKNYNAGVILIQEPSKEITKELQAIEANFFSDKEFILKNKRWPYNDEYAASYYIFKNKMQFEPNDTVALPYGEHNQPDVQSVHHTGLNKQSFFSDFSRTYTKLI